MGMIKKIISAIRGKYHRCSMCEGFEKHTLRIPGFKAYTTYEDHCSDAQGNIWIPCPACKGTGVIWK